MGFLRERRKHYERQSLHGFPGGQHGTVTGGPFTINDNEPKNGNTLSSVYVQDEWKPFDKWTINYGLRFDYMSAYVTADQLSPRLGVVYKVTPDTTLHAGYARYFTPPPDRADLTEDSVTVRQHIQRCGGP